MTIHAHERKGNVVRNSAIHAHERKGKAFALLFASGIIQLVLDGFGTKSKERTVHRHMHESSGQRCTFAFKLLIIIRFFVFFLL